MSKLRVLVVEDEYLLGEMLADVLTESDFDVEVVGNGAWALARLQGGSAYDVLFTDIDLGNGLDGVALSAAARELRPGLAVVYSSGSVTSVRGLNAVPRSIFVAKPYDVERLCATLREAAAQFTPA